MTSTKPVKKEETKEDTALTICTIGKTGNGKSTILNRFFGDKSKKGNNGAFEAKRSLKSVTLDVTSKTQPLKYEDPLLTKYNGKICKLIDTPGLADTEGRDHEIIEQLKKFFKCTCDGVNVFLVVMKVMDVRFDTTIQQTLNILHQLFGIKFWKHVMLVFTYHDADSDGEIDTVEDYTLVKQGYPKELKELYKFKNDLSVTAFGKNNYINGINDIIQFGLKQGLYTCKFMSNYNISQEKEKLKQENESLQEYLDEMRCLVNRQRNKLRKNRKIMKKNSSKKMDFSDEELEIQFLFTKHRTVGSNKTLKTSKKQSDTWCCIL